MRLIAVVVLLAALTSASRKFIEHVEAEGKELPMLYEYKHAKFVLDRMEGVPESGFIRIWHSLVARAYCAYLKAHASAPVEDALKAKNVAPSAEKNLLEQCKVFQDVFTEDYDAGLSDFVKGIPNPEKYLKPKEGRMRSYPKELIRVLVILKGIHNVLDEQWSYLGLNEEEVKHVKTAEALAKECTKSDLSANMTCLLEKLEGTWRQILEIKAKRSKDQDADDFELVNKLDNEAEEERAARVKRIHAVDGDVANIAHH